MYILFAAADAAVITCVDVCAGVCVCVGWAILKIVNGSIGSGAPRQQQTRRGAATTIVSNERARVVFSANKHTKLFSFIT